MSERYCFYCAGPIAKDMLERDHFPVPERHGGTLMVDACRGCHDLKDRFTIDAWHAEWVGRIVADFPMLSRETRIFLAKAMSMMADAAAKP